MNFAYAQIVEPVTEATTGPGSYTPALVIIILGTMVGGFLLAKLMNRHRR